MPKPNSWPCGDIVVLELLFNTGVRVSELCDLTADTFLWKERGIQFRIHGKGGKERILKLISPELILLFRRYWRHFFGVNLSPWEDSGQQS